MRERWACQIDFVWLPARVEGPHVGPQHVWCPAAERDQETPPPEKRLPFLSAGLAMGGSSASESSSCLSDPACSRTRAVRRAVT